ncbi:hypothetical protein BCU66_001425 [Vibrio sp. 10N.286.49.B1]|nr:MULTISPECIES: hypothetical protein [unclassified Vibrio]
MKAWIKFIPLVLLVTYVITYDVMDSTQHNTQLTNATQQMTTSE